MRRSNGPGDEVQHAAGKSVDEAFEAMFRRVLRDELQTSRSGKPEQLLKPEDVRRLLNLNNVQKVYALVREGQIEAIWISKREMRIAPSALKQFQLKGGIKNAQV